MRGKMPLLQVLHFPLRITDYALFSFHKKLAAKRNNNVSGAPGS